MAGSCIVNRDSEGKIIDVKVPSSRYTIPNKEFIPISQERFHDLVDRMKNAFKRSFGKVNVIVTDDIKGTLSEHGEAHIQNIMSNSSKIYGYKLSDGTIVINEEFLNANTPIHEFSHIWEQLNPTTWKAGVKLLKKTAEGKILFDEISNNPAYSNLTAEQQWSEALNHFIGNYGEHKFHELENDKSPLGKLIAWVRDLFNSIGRKLGVDVEVTPEMTLEEFAEHVLGEMTTEVVSEAEIEKQAIIEAAKADGTYMKAPNGKKTNLTEDQWATVRTSSFKEWFGDWIDSPGFSSKVVDENGEPMVVYHGSPVENITTFRDGSIFFAKDIEVAQGYAGENGTIYPSFLNFRVPLKEYGGYNNWNDLRPEFKEYERYRIVDSNGEVIVEDIIHEADANMYALDMAYEEAYNENNDIEYDDVTPYEVQKYYDNENVTTDALFEVATKVHGYDSVILENITDAATENEAFHTDVFIASDPGQVKSAISNVGNFSNKTKDIRFRAADGTVDNTAEREHIIENAKADGTYMKAPNGEDTNLSEEQWVTVRTRNFKNWFGDWINDPENASQAVDENGEPKIFYHNTNNEFNTFDSDRNGTNTDAGWLGDGFYFYGDKYEGDGYGNNKMEVFLNIRDMYYATTEENNELAEVNSREKSLEFRREVEFNGYDGVYYNGDLRQEAVVFHPNQIKSATSNNGDFSADNNDIRFQIIGERGAANLDQADENNIRMQDLSVAKEMEAAGKDSNEIWTVTGWEKGKDGQWRYEIPDLDKLDLKPIDLANESVNGKIWIDNELTLGELFHDNDLFKAYPELRDVKLGFVYFDNINLQGRFDPESKTIYLSRKTLGDTVAHSEENAKALKENNAKNKEVFKQGVKAFIEHLNKTKDIAAKGREVFNVMLSESTSKTLAHEIQHAIQDIEGFAKGGSELQFRDETQKDIADKVLREANAIFYGQSEEWRDKVRAINRAKLDQDFDLAETLESELEDDEAFYEYDNLMFEARDLMENPDRIVTTAFEQYHRLTGEVEARNVESRLNLSEQERAETPLSKTEDVSRENQRVINEYGGVSESQFKEGMYDPIVGATPLTHLTEAKSSEAFEELRGIPFVDDEVALGIYKGAYSKDIKYWRDLIDATNTFKNTGEPLVFYRTADGKIYSNISHALSNTATTYEVGFKDINGEFKSFATLTKFPANTLKGTIQRFIANQWLHPRSKGGEYVFEAVNSYAAQEIKNFLLMNGIDFTANGNTFDFTPIDYSYEGLKESVGERGAPFLAAVNNWFDSLMGKKRKSPRHTKEQLKEAILDFMKKVGITQSTIVEYSQKYKNKFGIEPGADAFIDIWNKIVATANGDATVEQLSEEVAHFIVEAWNQAEIDRLLPYVKNTEMYQRYAEQYREIYSKQHSDPAVVEKYVQKEILGKMLAETFNKDFSVENKSENETNLFDRLVQMLKDFFKFVQAKVLRDEKAQLDYFTEQIRDLLYNEQLDKHLDDVNPVSEVRVMYSVSSDTEVDKLLKALSNRIINNTGVHSELDIARQKGVYSVINDHVNKANYLLKELENNPNLSSRLRFEIEQLLSRKDDLESLLIYAEDLLSRSSKVERSDLKMITDAASTMFDRIRRLTLKYKSAVHKSNEEIARETLEMIGEDPDSHLHNEVLSEIQKEQKDVNALEGMFMHLGKLPNIFAQLLNKVMKYMVNKIHMDTYNIFEKQLAPLADKMADMKRIVSGGSFRAKVDMDKIVEARRRYEFEIRQKIGDSNVDGMTFEEFNEDYYDIKSIKDDASLYYKYKFLYDKDLHSQVFANIRDIDSRKAKMDMLLNVVLDKDALERGEDPLYRFLVQLDDIRMRDPQTAAIMRKEAASLYDPHTGKLRHGLQFMKYSQYQHVIKQNPNIKTAFIPASAMDVGKNLEANDYVIAISLQQGKNIPDSSILAFELNKWNQELYSKNKNVQRSIEGFKAEYTRFKKSIQHLNDADKHSATIKWFQDNVEVSDTTDVDMDLVGLNLKALRNSVSDIDRARLETIEAKLAPLTRQRQELLKLYRKRGDFREIDADAIPENIKHRILEIEAQIAEQKKDLAEIFDLYDIDMYKDGMDSMMQLNQSFHSVFKDQTGIEYKDATMKEKIAFFRHRQYGFPIDVLTKYERFNKLLEKANLDQVTEGQIKRYMDVAEDKTSKDSVREAFFRYNAPSWYRRYDNNPDYTRFVERMISGNIDVDAIIGDMIAGDFNLTRYGQNLKADVGFRYAFDVKRNINEIYDEYKAETNQLRKIALLDEMAGIQDLPNAPKENMSDILNNPSLLDTYIKTMDIYLESLDRMDSLKQDLIYQRPQVRKTDMERTVNLVLSKNKFATIKDAVKEAVQFRKDDFEDIYLQGKIPKYGILRINPSELTDDIWFSMVRFAHDSVAYKYRTEVKDKAVDILYAIENQKFSGNKSPKNTNIYKAMKENIDYNLYGKTVTMKWEFNIMGKKVDMAKIANQFKVFGVKQALGVGAMTALTNLTSGITNFQITKWAGGNIYSPASNRADKIWFGLMGDSTGDVGKLAPAKKLNNLLYKFGMYDITDRVENSQYGKKRLLGETAFAMMAITNYPVQSRILLTKLMESRLVDGKFQTWREYYNTSKMVDPSLTKEQIKRKFDASANKSMYDYLDEKGDFDMKRLENDGFKGDIEKTKTKMMSQAQTLSEATIMEIQSHNEGYAARDPRMSFFLVLKKWLVLALDNMFARKRLDLDTGGYEEGLFYSPKYALDMFNDITKNNKTLKEAWDNLEEYQRKNLKASGITMAALAAMTVIAIILRNMAGDDDEKDNYPLQLANYLLIRNLNETFGGSVGIGNSMYETLKSPLQILDTGKNISKLFYFQDIGEEVKRGKYKGMDKYAANILKLTMGKNIYSMKDGEAIYESWKGYEHFNSVNENALYHIFSLLPSVKKEK